MSFSSTVNIQTISQRISLLQFLRLNTAFVKSSSALDQLLQIIQSQTSSFRCLTRFAILTKAREVSRSQFQAKWLLETTYHSSSTLRYYTALLIVLLRFRIKKLLEAYILECPMELKMEDHWISTQIQNLSTLDCLFLHFGIKSGYYQALNQRVQYPWKM